MNKKQREVFKEIEKAVDAAMKQNAKQAGFKKVSAWIYKKRGDYFVCAFFFVQWIDAQYKLVVKYEIKRYCYDDILWNIFDMKENCSARESLRANGAFAVPAIEWNIKIYPITDVSCVEQVCKDALNEFCEESENFIQKTIAEFGSFDLFVLSQDGIWGASLLKMLALIHMEKYAEAEELANSEIKQGRGGLFRNKDIGVNKYISMYCRDHMSY